MDQEDIKGIRELIAQDKLKEAIRLFREETLDNNDLQNQVILLSNQLCSAENARLTGEIQWTDLSLVKTRIGNALLKSVAEFESNNSVQSAAPIIFRTKKNVKLGELQLVNCDRNKLFDLFEENRAQRISNNEKFHFYFICGCESQKPDSFAERIVHEIRLNENENQNYKTNFKTQVKDGLIRVLKEDLLFRDRKLNDSISLFKTYFQDRFEKDAPIDFDTFVETATPKLGYDQLGFVFKISEELWEEDNGTLLKYLKWFINEAFAKAHPELPDFLFLFVLEFENFHFPQKMRDNADKFFKNLKDELTHLEMEDKILDNIVPINEMHIKRWIKNIVAEDDSGSIGNILEDFKTSKPKPKTVFFDKEDRFQMKEVEKFQFDFVTKLLKEYKS